MSRDGSFQRAGRFGASREPRAGKPRACCLKPCSMGEARGAGLSGSVRRSRGHDSPWRVCSAGFPLASFPASGGATGFPVRGVLHPPVNRSSRQSPGRRSGTTGKRAGLQTRPYDHCVPMSGWGVLTPHQPAAPPTHDHCVPMSGWGVLTPHQPAAPPTHDHCVPMSGWGVFNSSPTRRPANPRSLCPHV